MLFYAYYIGFLACLTHTIVCEILLALPQMRAYCCQVMREHQRESRAQFSERFARSALCYSSQQLFARIFHNLLFTLKWSDDRRERIPVPCVKLTVTMNNVE